MNEIRKDMLRKVRKRIWQRRLESLIDSIPDMILTSVLAVMFGYLVAIWFMGYDYFVWIF